MVKKFRASSDESLFALIHLFHSCLESTHDDLKETTRVGRRFINTYELDTRKLPPNCRSDLNRLLDAREKGEAVQGVYTFSRRVFQQINRQLEKALRNRFFQQGLVARVPYYGWGAENDSDRKKCTKHLVELLDRNLVNIKPSDRDSVLSEDMVYITAENLKYPPQHINLDTDWGGINYKLLLLFYLTRFGIQYLYTRRGNEEWIVFDAEQVPKLYKRLYQEQAKQKLEEVFDLQGTSVTHRFYATLCKYAKPIELKNEQGNIRPLAKLAYLW